MKRKRFSVEQIVAVLKQAELGMPVAGVLRQIGISEQTFYRWKKQYAGLQADQVREMNVLQDENARLKKLVVEILNLTVSDNDYVGIANDGAGIPGAEQEFEAWGSLLVRNLHRCAKPRAHPRAEFPHHSEWQSGCQRVRGLQSAEQSHQPQCQLRHHLWRLGELCRGTECPLRQQRWRHRESMIDRRSAGHGRQRLPRRRILPVMGTEAAATRCLRSNKTLEPARCTSSAAMGLNGGGIPGMGVGKQLPWIEVGTTWTFARNRTVRPTSQRPHRPE